MKAKYIKMLNRVHEGLDQEGYETFFVVDGRAKKLTIIITLKDYDEVKQIVESFDCAIKERRGREANSGSKEEDGQAKEER